MSWTVRRAPPPIPFDDRFHAFEFRIWLEAETVTIDNHYAALEYRQWSHPKRRPHEPMIRLGADQIEALKARLAERVAAAGGRMPVGAVTLCSDGARLFVTLTSFRGEVSSDDTDARTNRGL